MARPTWHDSEQPPALRSVLLVLCFAAAFLVGAWLIRCVTPDPYVPLVTRKLRAFAALEDECNVIFIGTSQTQSSFDPRQFDERTAAAGIHTNSFNLGLGSTKLAEAYHLLRTIRALGDTHLEWVLIEPWMAVNVRPENARTRRVIGWHDVASTRMAIRATLHGPEPPEGRLTQAWGHLQHLGYYLGNVGRARFLLEDHLRNRLDPAVTDSTPDRRGFNAWRGVLPAPIRHSPGFLEDIPRYRMLLQNARENPEPPPLDGVRAELLLTVLREIEALGATPILLVPPSPLTQYGLSLPAGTSPVAVIRLDDTDRFPELFDIGNRWDPLHLNWEGARLATDHLADAFIRIVAEKGGR